MLLNLHGSCYQSRLFPLLFLETVSEKIQKHDEGYGIGSPSNTRDNVSRIIFGVRSYLYGPIYIEFMYLCSYIIHDFTCMHCGSRLHIC